MIARENTGWRKIGHGSLKRVSVREIL